MVYCESRTGLGLWIVKELVTMQGGVVGADFPDGGESIFWIELPAVREPDAVADDMLVPEAQNQAAFGT